MGGHHSQARLRRATSSDVRAIAEFQTRGWRQAYTGLVPQEYLDRMNTDEREVRWRRNLHPGGREAALALVGGEIVGVVSWKVCEADDVPPLELKSLYVDDEHHGSGLAAALTGLAIGDSPAFLWVFEQNPRARAFYTKQGFGPDGTRKIDPDTGIWELRMTRK